MFVPVRLENAFQPISEKLNQLDLCNKIWLMAAAHLRGGGEMLSKFLESS